MTKNIDIFDDKDESSHQQYKAFMDFKNQVESYIDEVYNPELTPLGTTRDTTRLQHEQVQGTRQGQGRPD